MYDANSDLRSLWRRVIAKSAIGQLAELLIALFDNVVLIEVARMIATALENEGIEAMEIWLAIGTSEWA
jgi:hypothetical protein